MKIWSPDLRCHILDGAYSAAMKTLILRIIAIMFSLISPWYEAEAHATLFKFRIAIEDADNRPYEYKLDGKWVGFHAEVIEAVAKKLDWDVIWIPIVWTKNYNTLYTDKADALSFLMRTPLRPEPNVIFSDDNILSYFEISVYARTDSPKVNLARKNFGNLARHPIGVIPGGITDRWASIVYPEIVLNRTPRDSFQLFQMLENHRFDFAIAMDYSYDVAVTSNPKIKDSIIKLTPHLTEAPAYLAFQNSERGKKMAEEFGNAFKVFRGSKDYRVLKAKYNIP